MTEGSINKVLYNVDQRADTTDAEKKTARDNIGALSAEDITGITDDRYKLLQYPVNQTYASYAVIDQFTQNRQGVASIHCSYLTVATDSSDGLMGAGDKAKLNTISYNAEQNVQADWDETDPSSDAYIRNKPSQSVQVQADWDETNTSLPSYIRNKPTIPSGNQLLPPATSADEDKVLAVDENGDPEWRDAGEGLMAVAHDTTLTGDGTNSNPLSVNSSYVQSKLTPGNGIQIVSDTISARVDGTTIDFDQAGNLSVKSPLVLNGQGTQTVVGGNGVSVENTTTHASTTINYGGVTLSDGTNSDTFDLGDLQKLNGIEAGAEVNVQSDWNQSNSTADDFIKNKPDLTVFATKSELNDKQDVLTPGTGITITNNVISATVDPQVQADWAQSDSAAVDYIKNKPQNLVQDADYVHTDNNFTDADESKLDNIQAGAEANVQANWAETDTAADSYIQNKPANLVQDANYVHTDNNFTTSEKTKLAGIQAGAEQNVQSDWLQDDSSADDFIKNKPANLVQDANYVHTDNNFTNADKTKLDGVEAGAEVNVQSDWNQTDTSADDYIKNKPVIPEIPPMKELVAGSGIGLVETEFDVTISATTQSDNNFTDAYKTKLDGIAAGAEVNVQANWNETNSSSDAFIKNKPTVPELSWQQETQGSSNSFPADQLKIHQDYHTVTMHTTGGSDVQLGYVVPNPQSADDGKVLKAINDGVGGTAITWGDLPEQVNADWNASSGAAEILNKPSIPDIVSTTTSLPPVDTDIATLRIFTDGRVQGGSSTLGCLAPEPAQADSGKVLVAYWAGSPAIGTARWEPAPEAHTFGFIDVVL